MGVMEVAWLSFGAYRLWSIWLYAEISRPWRERLQRRGGKIGYLAGCGFCVSVWAGFVALGLWSAGTAGQWLIMGLVVGGFVPMIEVGIEVLTRLPAAVSRVGSPAHTIPQNGAPERAAH